MPQLHANQEPRYVPSPAEIQAACQRFQADWTPQECQERAPWAFAEPVELRPVRLIDLHPQRRKDGPA